MDRTQNGFECINTFALILKDYADAISENLFCLFFTENERSTCESDECSVREGIVHVQGKGIVLDECKESEEVAGQRQISTRSSGSLRTQRSAIRNSHSGQKEIHSSSVNRKTVR